MSGPRARASDTDAVTESVNQIGRPVHRIENPVQSLKVNMTVILFLSHKLRFRQQLFQTFPEIFLHGRIGLRYEVFSAFFTDMTYFFRIKEIPAGFFYIFRSSIPYILMRSFSEIFSFSVIFLFYFSVFPVFMIFVDAVTASLPALLYSFASACIMRLLLVSILARTVTLSSVSVRTTGLR